MNIKDFKWTEKRFGTRFATILKNLIAVRKDSTETSLEYEDTQGNVTKLVTDSTFSSLLAKNGLIEVKWQELKDKRDNGQLIPGSLYRITDYNCTTTQENTRSAGHQFDIVLLALSENKLAEEGWAMMHDNIYDVTFSDGVTKKCYLYYEETSELYNLVDIETLLGVQMDLDSAIEGGAINIDHQNKTILISPEAEATVDILTEENVPYNYFQNSNLSAWKVWYCLDNDKSRFAWADDSVIGDIENIVVYYPERTGLGGTIPAHDAVYTLTNETQIVNGVTYFKLVRLEGVGSNELFVDTKNINTETTLYTFDPRSGAAEASPDGIIIKSINYNTPPTEEGRGVIYRLIDEFNNDVAYDFKNIQFIRPMTDGDYDPDNGEDTWVYTFTKCVDVVEDGSLQKQCSQNYIQSTSYGEGLELPNNVLLTTNDGEGNMYCVCNSIKRDSSGNTLLYGCSVIELIMCNNCVISEGMYQMTIHWGNEEGEFDEGDGYLYVLNKKVLIEE